MNWTLSLKLKEDISVWDSNDGLELIINVENNSTMYCNPNSNTSLCD